MQSETDVALWCYKWYGLGLGWKSLSGSILLAVDKKGIDLSLD